MRRLLVGISCLLVLAPVVAGCDTGARTSASGDRSSSASATPSASPPATPADRLRAAVAATRSTSAQVTMRSTLPSVPVLTITGTYDFSKDTGTLAAVLPGGAISRLDERLTPETVYFRGAAPAPKGQWVAVSRKDITAHYLFRLPANDPAFLLRQLLDLKEVTLAGGATIDGVATTRYRGHIGRKAFLQFFDPALAPRVQQVVDLFEAQEQEPRAVDVWVDRSGRVVRTLQAVAAPQAVSYQMDLRSFGQPVAVQIPPSVPGSSLTGILAG